MSLQTCYVYYLEIIAGMGRSLSIDVLSVLQWMEYSPNGWNGPTVPCHVEELYVTAPGPVSVLILVATTALVMVLTRTYATIVHVQVRYKST